MFTLVYWSGGPCGTSDLSHGTRGGKHERTSDSWYAFVMTEPYGKYACVDTLIPALLRLGRYDICISHRADNEPLLRDLTPDELAFYSERM